MLLLYYIVHYIIIILVDIRARCGLDAFGVSPADAYKCRPPANSHETAALYR